MTKQSVLEAAFFAWFVVVIDAFSLGIAPVLGSATLVSFLAFVVLEDYMGNRSRRASGVK
jgi:L-cystine uptake protein TcyP (sodium:dicarboxylate symporter family)